LTRPRRARHASGTVPRDQAVASLNDALACIKMLAGRVAPAQVTPETPVAEGVLRQRYLALILAGRDDRRGVQPDLGAAP